MKKYLLLCIIVITFIIGCTQINQDESNSIHSYYDSNPVLLSEIDEFIKIKTMIFKVGELNNEIKEKIDVDSIDSTDKCREFLLYKQYDLSVKITDFYLNMSKEEKEQDYYVALERIDYYTNLFRDEGSTDKVDEITEFNRYIIFDNPEYSSTGMEVKNNLMDMAEKKGMSFEEYVEQYYLTVAIEMDLSSFTPLKYIEQKYSDMIVNYPDISVLTKKISDEELSEIVKSLDEYYSFVEKVWFGFYEHLLEKSNGKIT